MRIIYKNNKEYWALWTSTVIPTDQKVSENYLHWIAKRRALLNKEINKYTVSLHELSMMATLLKYFHNGATIGSTKNRYQLISNGTKSFLEIFEFNIKFKKDFVSDFLYPKLILLEIFIFFQRKRIFEWND